MKAQDLMTENPAWVTPDDTAKRVAQLMADNDCGCLPVVDGRTNTRVVGVVTDRDIALRGVANGKGPDTPVRELMSTDLVTCSPDSDVREVQRAMADHQLRRVVIADADGGCVGIVSQADRARAAADTRVDVGESEVMRIVERISERPTASRVARA